MFKSNIKKVKWDDNIDCFFEKGEKVKKVENCNLILAVWSKQFENCDSGNPALPFIREMQSSGYQVAALTCIALYKPAVSVMRTVFETALYYTYFRVHPVELATLLRNEKFFIQKSDIVSYHKMHTPHFTVTEQAFGLLSRTDSWYQNISAALHGQIPGSLTLGTALSDLSHNNSIMNEVVENFIESVKIINAWFLCTVGREKWDDFSSNAKKTITKGLSKSTKSILGIDTA